MITFTCSTCHRSVEGLPGDTACVECLFAHRDRVKATSAHLAELEDLDKRARGVGICLSIRPQPTGSLGQAAEIAATLAKRIDDRYGDIESEIEELKGELDALETLSREAESLAGLLKGDAGALGADYHTPVAQKERLPLEL